MMQTSPQTYQQSFGAAHWALIFALALPLTVMLFGLVRARQFHAKLDSKWARSSPLVAFRSETARQEVEEDDAQKNAEPAELDAADELPTTIVSSRSIIDSSHTGSASGHQSIDIRVRSNKFDGDDLNVAEGKSKRGSAKTAERHHELELSSEILESAGRIEAHVKQVHQSVDQLTRKLNEHRAEDSQQQARILEQQNQLLDQGAKVCNAIEKLEEVTENTLIALVIDASARRHSARGPHPLDEQYSHQAPIVREDGERKAEIPPVEKEVQDSQTSPQKIAMDSSARTIESSADHPSEFYAPIRAHVDTCQDNHQPATSKADDVIEQPRVLNEFQSPDGSIRIVREVGKQTVDLYTIDLENADLHSFLERLSEVAPIGIIPSPGIEGRMTLHVQKRRLDAVLQAIAKSRDYVIERNGGIATIRTAQEVAQSKNRRIRTAARPTTVR